MRFVLAHVQARVSVPILANPEPALETDPGSDVQADLILHRRAQRCATIPGCEPRLNEKTGSRRARLFEIGPPYPSMSGQSWYEYEV